MAATLTVWIPGVAIPKPSVRGRIIYDKGRPSVQMMHGDHKSTPKDRKFYGKTGWKERMMSYLRHESRRAGWVRVEAGVPVALHVGIFLPRTTTARANDTLKPTRPDYDNYMKGICDAMTECEVWADDGQVCGGQYLKAFAPRGDQQVRYMGALIQLIAPYDEPDLWGPDSSWKKIIDQVRF